MRMLMPVTEQGPAKEVLVMNDLASKRVAHSPIQAQFPNRSNYEGHLSAMRPDAKAQLASGERYAAC